MKCLTKTILFVLVIQAFLFSGIGTYKFKWVRVYPPFKTDFTDIVFDNKGNGYIAGSYLFKIVDNKLQVLNPPPPTVTVNRVFSGNGLIWTTNENFLNESSYHVFNGKTWKGLKNPLANQIIYARPGRGNEMWLGGDRELAYFNGKTWKFYPFPSYKGAVLTIIPKNENDFLFHIGSINALYRYFYGKYTIVANNINLIYESEDGTVYTLSDGEISILNNYRQEKFASIDKAIPVSSFHVDNKSSIWVTSEKGNLYYWNGDKWKQTKLPTEETLNKIVFYKNDGWICGNGGVLFRYAPAVEEKKSVINSGFTKKRILAIRTPHNNEYGTAIADLNNDGFYDIVTAKLLASNRLYINNLSQIIAPEGVSFTEQSFERGMTIKDEATLVRAGLYIGVNTADVDNNGGEDIYFSNLMGKNKLYLNSGSGYFEDVTNESNRGIDADKRSNTAVFGDVDNDSDLDMLVINEEGSNTLYANDGTGHFTDVTLSAGLISKGSGMSASFADIDNDNDLDLCIVNWAAGNKLYRNESKNGVISFKDITKSSNIDLNPYEKNNSVLFSDFDNDGDMDLFITKRKSPNRLYLNDGKGNFTDKTKEMLGLDTLYSYGAVASDFDNDGYQDIYITCVGSSKFYKNINGTKFINATEQFNAEVSGYGTGAAVADFDNDGDLDIYSSVYIEGESTILLNNINTKNFIKLNIKGTLSNRDAVGVKLWFYKAGHKNQKEYLLGYREISGGLGYCSGSAKQVHFGTGENSLVDIIIYFPASGITKELVNVKQSEVKNISEEEGLKGFSTLTLNSLWRFLRDSYTHILLLHIFIITIIFYLSVKRSLLRFKWSRGRILLVHLVVLGIWLLQVLLFDKKSIFTAMILPVALALLSLALIHLIYERIILVRFAAQERQKVRDRIARDLHDELASNLSSAQIYTDVLRRKTAGDSDLISKISILIKDSSEAVSDIIWNISPKNDSLENLFLKLKTMSVDLASAVNIKTNIKEEINNKDFILNDRLRRNLFLIYKEAFNNMLKYSTAKECSISLVECNGEIIITLSDNGKGIGGKTFTAASIEQLTAAAGALRGNGLKNLFSRTEEIDGSLILKSMAESGTTMELKVKMT